MKAAITTLLASAFVLAAAPARSQVPTLPTAAHPVRNFDVFVDPPTGFVFVKLPQGWKFAGKIDEAQLASLPPSVITSLLAEEPAATAQVQPASK